MRALAAQPNVWLKISGLGMVDWRWTEDSIRPFVLETIEILGLTGDRRQQFPSRQAL